LHNHHLLDVTIRRLNLQYCSDMTLNQDILWSIFMINASDLTVKKRERLATTRLTSQVCRQWRQQVLTSSQLWGRLILLAPYQRKEWMEEIMTRACESRIWLEISIPLGTSVEEADSLFSSFITVLHDCWDRIEMLEAFIASGCLSEQPNNQLWLHMSKPAPNLRLFAFSDPGHRDRGKVPLSPTIFASNAPMLRSLTSTFKIIHHAKWLSGLETLRFIPDSLDNLSEVLQWTPRLCALRISAPARLFSLPRAKCTKLQLLAPFLLPKLAYIEAEMTVEAFTSLWSTPSQTSDDFSSSLEVLIRNEVSVGTEQQAFKNEISSAISNFLPHHCGSASQSKDIHWSLTMFLNIYRVQVICPSPSLDIGVVFTRPNSSEMPQIHTILLDCFRPYLQYATSFSLNISTSLVVMSTHENQTDLSTSMAATLSSMTEVRNISTTMEIIALFFQIDCRGRFLFPKLEFINLEGILSTLNTSVFLSFIARRINASKPRMRVQYTNQNSSIQEVCQQLNEIKNSRLRWYLCDSLPNEMRCERI